MGLECLVEKLGIVNAEHFIATIKRESFDYTAWLTRCLQDRLGEKRDNMQKAIHIRGKGKEFNFI